MIPVKRLEEPSILTDKRVEWQAKFDARRAANSRARPEKKQYAHPTVVATLEAMSHGKCFYCEGEGQTVDHYIEIAERSDLAFTWENLYLACQGCQGKIRNTSLPVSECVDPCDPLAIPAEHLSVDREYIRFRTPRGEATVKKYRLNRDPLVSERRRILQRFTAELLEIGKTKAWPTMTAEERQRLLRHGQADARFSLVIRAYLVAHGIA